MSECYTIGGDSWQPLAGFDIVGQTFTPLESHTIQFFDADLWLWSTTPPLVYLIRCDASHTPVYPILSDARPVEPLIFLPPAQRRVRFKLDTPISLTAGEVYVMCFRKALDHIGPDNMWLYDADDATYPRGHIIFSDDGGNTWTHFPNSDFIFCEFGGPPLPKPEPPPPIPYFAILDISYYRCHLITIITVPTNVPCHLTCYYTPTQPRKHHDERTIRGLLVPWGVYFCFVGWLAVEQNEPGDTLYHTFTIPNWPTYQIRWFTFRGTVDGEIVPSVGPIIEWWPIEETPYQNTLLWNWPDPKLPPIGWVYSMSGPGSSSWQREEIDFKTIPYAATLIARGARQRTIMTQVSCAHPYGSKTLKFEFWFRTVGYGQVTIYLEQTGPGGWDWGQTWGPTRWIRRSITRYIHPDAESFIFRFANASITGLVSIGRFDGITITEV